MADQEPAVSTWDKVQAFIKADQQKAGGMSLSAHGRLGLAELREVFSPGGNIAQQTPHGMWGTITPGEVAAGRELDPGSFGVHGPAVAPTPHDGGSVHGPVAQDTGPSPAPATPEQIADRHQPAADQEGGVQPARSPEQIADNITLDPGKQSFVEKELERERNRQGDEEQSKLERGRVLPDEQLENDKGRSR